MWPSALVVSHSLTAAFAPAATSAPAEPYKEFRGGGFHAPLAPLSDSPSRALGVETEVGRRKFELALKGEAVSATCSGEGSAHCGARIHGAAWGGAALYRPVPQFALGLSAQSARYFVPRAGGAGASGAKAWFGGVAGRVYGFEEGSVDAYVELSLGVGALSFENGTAEGSLHEQVELAPAARIAAGVDWSVGQNVRVGPLLSWTRYAPDSVERCLGDCSAILPSQSAIPRSSFSLGLGLTLSVGEPL